MFCLFSSVISLYRSIWIWLLLILEGLSNLPIVAGAKPSTSFPDISFQVFSTFIQSTFSSQISLATVILVLFTMLENPDLLNIHAHQKHPQCGLKEKKTRASAWFKFLARALVDESKTNY